MALCSVQAAAARVSSAANEAAGTPTFQAAGVQLTSAGSETAVEAELDPKRNPGANDSEWMCTLSLEGTPEDLRRM